MRQMMASAMAALLAAALAAGSDAPGVNGDEALARLLAGNQRYVAGKPSQDHRDPARRTEVAKGQHPIAVIVSCSDSRVPPEIVFDQGLGDLFVVRVAGNVVGDDELGSIEYAVEHLGPRLVLVLGHERCGAVDATVKGGEAPGHVAALVKAIRPACESVKAQAGDPVDNCVRANAARVAAQLKASEPIVAGLVKKGLTIVAGRYDLDTGVVELLK